MKKLFIALMVLPVAVFAQLVKTPPLQITAPLSDPAIRIVGSTNQQAAYMTIHNETNAIFVLHKDGGLSLYASTNFIKFGTTNTAPASTNAVTWVSVQISGDTNAYRLPLMK